MNKINYLGSVIAVTGAAGSGKDTIKDMIQENISNQILTVSFAETLKSEFATALFLSNPKLLNQYPADTHYVEALNDLKDNHPEIKVIGDMHARRALQIFGTEVWRSIDENVHVRFMASKMVDALQKDPNVVFFSNDVRFPNELDFFLKLGQIKDKAKLDNYLRDIVSQAPEYPNYVEINKKLEKEFGVSGQDQLLLHLTKIMDKDLNKLKNTPKPFEPAIEVKNLSIQDLNPTQSFNVGLISLFRPLIDPNKRVSKNLTSLELDKVIMDFNKFTDSELDIQKKTYDANKLNWDVETVKKQGFVRPGIDIFHPSETSLLTLLPENKTISYPMRRDKEALKNSILGLLKSQSLVVSAHSERKEKLDKGSSNDLSSPKI